MYRLRGKSTLFLNVKIWLLTIMLVPAIAWAQADSTVPEPATAESVEAKAETPEDQIGGWQPLAPDARRQLALACHGRVVVFSAENDFTHISKAHENTISFLDYQFPELLRGMQIRSSIQVN